MKKNIITQFGKIINFNQIEKIYRKTVIGFDDYNKLLIGDKPFAILAVMKTGEIVNIGNFSDYDMAEIIEIMLDVFETNKKSFFEVNLQADGVKKFIDFLKKVTEEYYPLAIDDIKISIANGDLDVYSE